MEFQGVAVAFIGQLCCRIDNDSFLELPFPR